MPNTLAVVNSLGFDKALTIHPGHWLKITRPDGSVIRVRIIDPNHDPAGNGSNTGTANGSGNTLIAGRSDTFTIGLVDAHGLTKQPLNWHNCYSFGNGVESNRITDTFNTPQITPGVRVSTIFEDYKEEHRKYGLIYSGLYNSISSVNNLNQFIQAEKITKDINPIYGSIQKLHTRDTDLIALCEDKVLRILASKDAVYNADGNLQLTATNRVLGQAVPFVGEFGISQNPESFVSEAYRSYFTDKQRGTVMRLSKDGLTPISMHGMKDWFRDNLKLSDKLIGSYDDRNDEYNITLKDIAKTVSFREDVTGWVSFKSFVPENAISCANDYFTIKNGKLYKHYDEYTSRNTFYDTYTDSSVNVILNEQPGSVKSFHTLDYEGSQSRVEGIKTITVNRRVMSPPTGRYFEIESEEDFNYIKYFTNATESIATSGARKITLFIKQYRNNILIKTGTISAYYPTIASGNFTPHGQFNNWSISDWEDGDIITTEEQEKTVNHFNSIPKDGWYVSDFTTDKQVGSLPEFIEKEGKWFNYVKGIDSDVDSTTDFGAFDIQGIGIVQNIKPRNIVDMNRYTVIDPGFTVSSTSVVSWSGDPTHLAVNYILNVMNSQDIVTGENYRLVLEVSNYSGTGDLGVSHNAGVSGTARIEGDGTYTEDFTSDGNRLDIFGRNTNSANIELSVTALPPLDGELIFDHDINSSLQIGDTLYFETPSEVLGEELVENGDFSVTGGSSWNSQGATDFTTNVGSVIIGDSSATYSSIKQLNILTIGKEYNIRVDVLASSQPSSLWPYISINNNDGNATHSANYHYIGNDVGSFTYRWKANVVDLELYASGHPNYGQTMEIDNIFVKELMSGNIFGFNRLESDKLQKCGVVTILTNNTVTVDNLGTPPPSVRDYIMFAKNHAVNTSSLLGYYADIKFENNSINKVELFSVGSEITESSK